MSGEMKLKFLPFWKILSSVFYLMTTWKTLSLNIINVEEFSRMMHFFIILTLEIKILVITWRQNLSFFVCTLLYWLWPCVIWWQLLFFLVRFMSAIFDCGSSPWNRFYPPPPPTPPPISNSVKNFFKSVSLLLGHFCYRSEILF